MWRHHRALAYKPHSLGISSFIRFVWNIKKKERNEQNLLLLLVLSFSSCELEMRHLRCLRWNSASAVSNYTAGLDRCVVIARRRPAIDRFSSWGKAPTPAPMNHRRSKLLSIIYAYFCHRFAEIKKYGYAYRHTFKLDKERNQIGRCIIDFPIDCLSPIVDVSIWFFSY